MRAVGMRAGSEIGSDRTGAVIEEFQARLQADVPLDQVLGSLAETVTLAIGEVDAASITILRPQGPATVASTCQAAAEVDRYQYDAGRGPCLDAAARRRIERGVASAAEVRWPEFATAIGRHGYSSYLSVPLPLDQELSEEGELAGSLNAYGRGTAFDQYDEQLVSLLITTASVAITNSRRWHRARREVGQLQAALGSRPEIEQAKGVLMAVHSCTADEAFARLADRSQRTNTKLFDVARELLASLRE